MDVKMIETGNGGDLVFANGDIQLTSEVYNQPYLAHFGGNKEAISADYQEGEERLDFWMNPFLPDNEKMNSTFEKGLNTIPLSSGGRAELEQLADDDLQYLKGFANTQSSVSIISTDKVQLKEQINNENVTDFSYIWENAKDEILTND